MLQLRDDKQHLVKDLYPNKRKGSKCVYRATKIKYFYPKSVKTTKN